jgi:hypothetical protein
MKHKRQIFLCALITAFCLTGYVFAQSGSPGSSDDPAVSKSYVDAQLAEIKTYIDTKASGSSPGNGGSFAVFTPILVKSGATLIGMEGTELILRSGAATAIEVDHNGIADLTAGKDLGMNEKVVQNHYLIIPKSDGRGIRITSNEDAWVMVKGGYTIQE